MNLEDMSLPKITLSVWLQWFQMALPALAPKAKSTPVSACKPFACAK